MPYFPPHYAPRDDWETVLPNIGTGNSVNSWVFDMLVYLQLTTPPRPLPPPAAWRRMRMPRDHARAALSQARQPPRPDNSSGLVPTVIITRLFARALAESVDADAEAAVEPGRPIRPTMPNETRAFTPPRYRPRPDWQVRLEHMNAEEGTWQHDLARYWKLRLAGRSERAAWSDVAMTPANARMALEEQDADDAGLIPSLPGDQETVARRVLARSVATNIDPNDLFEGLVLEPA